MKPSQPNVAHQLPIWREVLQFTVPGVPHAKRRPRFAKLRNGGVKVHPHKLTKLYEDSVGWHAMAMAKGVRIPKGLPIRIDILAKYPRPQRLAKAPADLLPKFVKTHGDLDNHIKAILDGLNQTLWHDDAQVQCIRAEAVYQIEGRRPCSCVIIYLPELANHRAQPTKETTDDVLETGASGTDS